MDSQILDFFGFYMQVNITYGAMMLRLAVFCVIVTYILLSGCPINLEVFLVLLIAHPIKMHVHGFGYFLDNSFDY